MTGPYGLLIEIVGMLADFEMQVLADVFGTERNPDQHQYMAIVAAAHFPET